MLVLVLVVLVVVVVVTAFAASSHALGEFKLGNLKTTIENYSLTGCVAISLPFPHL